MLELLKHKERMKVRVVLVLGYTPSRSSGTKDA